MRYPDGNDCRDDKKSASFPILERFTDHLGWMRKGLAVMLGGLLLSPPALAVKTEPRKERSAARSKPVSSSLKNQCQGDATAECWNAVATRLAKEGRLEEARQAIEQAFQADPRLAALRGNLEKVYANLARQAYDSALGLSKASPQVDLASLPRTAVRSKTERPVQTPASKPSPSIKPLVVEPKAETLVVKSVPTVAPVAVPQAPVRPEPAPAAKVAPVETAKPVAKPIPVPESAKASVPVPSIPKPLPLVAARKDTVPVVRPAPASELPPRVQSRPRPVPVDTVARIVAKPAVVKPRKDSVRTAKAEVRKRPDPAADRRAVRQALEAWAAHWSAKDVEGYLSCYAPSFVPANGSERAAWEAQRRERLTAPASIEVKLESLHLESQDSGRVSSEFLQAYKTEAVKLRSRKRLLWERIGSDWKIVSEGEAK